MSKIQTEYTPAVQTLFVSMMVTQPELYTRVSSILNPENFSRPLDRVVEFISEHSTKYSSMPTPSKIKTCVDIPNDFGIEIIPDLNEGDTLWFLDEFEKFTRQKELQRAIVKTFEMLDSGDFDPVEKIIKDAVQISLQRDLGLDYFNDPRERLIALKQGNGQVSTGWKALDKKLFGGFNRGELEIFCGGSGAGKSLFLQNLSVNLSSRGLNGVYITLELSEELSAMRIDSILTDTKTTDIFKNLDEVELKVCAASKKSGQLRIKYFPAQSTINHIRAYCKELQVQTGIKLDFVCIDYLDLMMPASVKVNPSDAFVKDKYVSEEIRNFAKELGVVGITCSQLNRDAVGEEEFDHSHIAGGISKINTADNVFGIHTSLAMKERGRYRLQLLKTRSSAGVGHFIELGFNMDTLKIFDLPEDGSDEETVSESNTGKPVAKVSQGLQVKQLLNRLKQ